MLLRAAGALRIDALMLPKAEYIDSDSALREACQRWEGSAVLALDTEFMRERTFYAKTALVQVSNGAHIGLIDPLAVKDVTPLAERMSDPHAVKVLHACREDLEILHQWLGAFPEPLFDTQLAANLEGRGRDISYRALVSDTQGVELDKSQTRTNWLQRPLSQDQLSYAALDVEYLPAIYAEQKATLAGLERMAWLDEDCAQHIEHARRRDVLDNYYQRAFALLALDSACLALLRALSRWRERTARQRDMPRPWLLNDKQMIAIAKLRPASQSEVREILGRRHAGIAGALRKVVEQADAGDAGDGTAPKRLPARTQVDALLARVAQAAKEHGMEPSVLATRGECVELLWRHEGGDIIWPQRLRGWRGEVLAQCVMDVLEATA